MQRLTPLVVALALGACGDANGSPRCGLPIPMADVCIPTTGFSSVNFDYMCMNGFGDGMCTVVIESSDGSVVAITPSVVFVPQNATHRIVLTTSSLVFGTATLTILHEDGSRSQLGVVQVGGC